MTVLRRKDAEYAPFHPYSWWLKLRGAYFLQWVVVGAEWLSEANPSIRDSAMLCGNVIRHKFHELCIFGLIPYLDSDMFQAGSLYSRWEWSVFCGDHFKRKWL